MLDSTGKFLPGPNTLAYLASSSATEKKSIITLTLAQCITIFSIDNIFLPVAIWQIVIWRNAIWRNVAASETLHFIFYKK
jgi:hypothetical protein